MISNRHTIASVKKELRSPLSPDGHPCLGSLQNPERPRRRLCPHYFLPPSPVWHTWAPPRVENLLRGYPALLSRQTSSVPALCQRGPLRSPRTAGLAGKHDLTARNCPGPHRVITWDLRAPSRRTGLPLPCSPGFAPEDCLTVGPVAPTQATRRHSSQVLLYRVSHCVTAQR